MNTPAEKDFPDKIVTQPTIRLPSGDNPLHSVLTADPEGSLGFLGRYRVLSVIGQGGMGLVLRGFDPRLDRLVALKVIRPDIKVTQEDCARFLREAKAAAAVHSEYVVTIFEVGEQAGLPWLAMELLEGESLEDYLERVGRLPHPEVRRLGYEIAKGLAEAHDRNLIHRDIKPDNIWLIRAPNSPSPEYRIKLLDFGLARHMSDDQRVTSSGYVVGTPLYMSPEQARGKFDHRSDLFSLGCVLYRALTGEFPFHGDTPLDVMVRVSTVEAKDVRVYAPDTPPDLAATITRLLAKNPAHRPADARAVGALLLTRTNTVATPMIPAAPLAEPVSEIGKVAWADLDTETETETEKLSLRTPSPTKRSAPFRPWMIGLGVAAVVIVALLLLLSGSEKPKGAPIAEETKQESPRLKPNNKPKPKKVDSNEPLILKASATNVLPDRITSVEFARDGSFVMVAIEGKKVYRCDPLTLDQERVIDSPFDRETRLAIHPDTRTFMMWSPFGDLIRETLTNGAPEMFQLTDIRAGVEEACYSPDGRTILWTGKDNRMNFFDRIARQFTPWLIPFDGPTPGRRVEWLSDGQRCLIGGYPYRIRGRRGELFGTLAHPDEPTGGSVRLSRDNKFVAIAHEATGSISVLRITGEVLTYRKGVHAKGIEEIAWIGDGKLLASSGKDGRVCIWNIRDLSLAAELPGHGESCRGLAIRNDGRYLISGGSDKTLRLWDLREVEERAAKAAP